MRWRVRPLGCLAAAMIAVATLGLIGVLVLRAGRSGNGSRGLEITSLEPPAGARDAGVRRTGGSSRRQRTYELAVRDGQTVAFTVSVRNTNPEPVTLTGVRRDRGGDDGVFAPEGLGVTRLPPGATARVEVRGRIDGCDRSGGQIVGKDGQRFQVAGGEEVDVPFGVTLAFDCG